MTQMVKYNEKKLSELFHQYLMEKFDGALEEAGPIQDTAEQVLPFTINEYFGLGCNSIYDLQDESQIEELRKKIKAHNILKNLDLHEEPRYTEVLKWYRLFLKSLQKQIAPLHVPGEQEAYPTVVADHPVSPVKHNDADYDPDTEGVEHQFNLTKKERNPELRRKCIEYYKSLWGGHIHCICCGFDFEKAYGDIGKDYIEVHHVNPHHTYKGEHMVDPTQDLIPLCSNCHSMIHRVPGQGECMTLRQLKDKYKGIRYND